MALEPSQYLYTKRTRKKGRGVFAKTLIPKGTVFEKVPLLIVDLETIDESMLMDYVYDWGRDTVAVALGYGSLYNHSYKPNARYEDQTNRTKHFIALRDIKPDEEVTINYNGNPKSKDKLDFTVHD